MPAHNEDEAKVQIEERLRSRGWDITDFSVTRKRWRDHLDGEEADRVFLHDGKAAAILEAKKPGKDLWASLDDIRKNNYNLTAGRYCPHQAEAQEHEPPEVLINRLLDLEREIQSDLEELLDMISSPKEDQAQEAHA